MDLAAKSLRTTKQSIAEIAASSGYENQGKFGTVFKKIYGVTPLEYRRQNINSTNGGYG
jgi:AraC-like DNA-binding protein